MIVEVATIRVRDGEQAAFEAAARQAEGVFRRAAGCLGFAVNHCIEDPASFDVVIHWNTLEDHTVGFRNSLLFAEWRALVGPYFAEPPSVRHHAPVFGPVTF